MKENYDLRLISKSLLRQAFIFSATFLFYCYLKTAYSRMNSNYIAHNIINYHNRLSITVWVSVHYTVGRRLRGYEMMNMIRKGQIQGVEKGNHN
jgi:hypothetical protein